MAIIGVLVAIAIPMYKAHTTKARVSEVVNALGHLAKAIGIYQDEAGAGLWLDCLDMVAIRTTLGVGLSSLRVSAIRIDQATQTIEATLQGIGVDVDGRTLALNANQNADGSISWQWSGTIPPAYLPTR